MKQEKSDRTPKPENPRIPPKTQWLILLLNTAALFGIVLALRLLRAKRTFETLYRESRGLLLVLVIALVLLTVSEIWIVCYRRRYAWSGEGRAESLAPEGTRLPPLLLRRRLPGGGLHRSILFILYHCALLLGACVLLTLCTLKLSYSCFDPKIYQGYFEKPLIFWVNYIVVISVALVLFALTGRVWIAYALTALIWMGVAIGNYFLIMIRNDPLQFEDLTCIREALAITDTAGYELRLSGRLLFCVAVCVETTILLALVSRWQMRLSLWRIPLLVLTVLAAILGCARVMRDDVWKNTKHYKYINTWSVTEIYVSRGIAYSFARSASTASNRPQGYKESEAAALYGGYSDRDIPQNRKVDVIVIMRESYTDLSDLDCRPGSLDFSCYDYYHELASESLVGTLVTNGFGGNTKNAERCFLTGNYTLEEWRKPVNSYVWYLRGQGYYTEGAHPFNGWFYNRQNINRYLGFQNYMFREDGFDELVGTDEIADDDVLYDQIWNQYQTFLSENDGPYFNFSVTYEGHGPYHYRRNDYSSRYVLQDANTSDGIAMNNYLSIVYHRDQELRVLVDRLRTSDRPVVLVLFGDHKPTLGADVNNYTTSAYSSFDMDLDLSTETGFLNYYSTEYLIWMNDAAKEQLGMDPAGQIGPTISPCYLMNVLFGTLDWGPGPAYLQAMEPMLETFPVYSTKGRVSIRGELRTNIPGDLVPQYRQMQYLSYYWRTNFFYEKLK